MANRVDNGGMVVSLLGCREPQAFVKYQCRLLSATFALLRFRDRRDEFSETATINNFLGWLALVIELPVAFWIAVGRIQDRMVKKWIAVGHALVMSLRHCILKDTCRAAQLL